MAESPQARRNFGFKYIPKLSTPSLQLKRIKKQTYIQLNFATLKFHKIYSLAVLKNVGYRTGVNFFQTKAEGFYEDYK